MAKDILFSQCKLRRGEASQITWIPQRYAKKGKPLRLKDGGVWEDGWVVDEVYSSETEEVVRALARAHKHMSSVTDIPKRRKKKR